MDVHVVVVAWDTHHDKLEAIRKAVFGEEQNIPAELDLDGADPSATHVLAITAAGQPVACGRLEPSGKIGRMAVLPDWRRRGLAGRMLKELIEKAQAAGLTTVYLHAQDSARGFYRRFGFASTGSEFTEAGITHQRCHRYQDGMLSQNHITHPLPHHVYI